MVGSFKTCLLSPLLLLAMLACGFTHSPVEQDQVESNAFFSTNYDKISDLVKDAGDTLHDDTGAIILGLAASVACDLGGLQFFPEVVRVEEAYLKYEAIGSGKCNYVSPVNKTTIDLSSRCDREEAKIELCETFFTAIVASRVFIMESALVTLLQWRLTKGEDFLAKYRTIIFMAISGHNVVWKHDPELVMESINQIYNEYYAKYIEGVSSDSTLNFAFMKSVSYLYRVGQEVFDRVMETRTDIYGNSDNCEISNYVDQFCDNFVRVLKRAQTAGKNLTAHLGAYWDLRAVELAVSTLLHMTPKADLGTTRLNFTNPDLITLKMETLDRVRKALVDGDLKTAVSVATAAMLGAEIMEIVDPLHQSFDAFLRLVWVHVIKYFNEGSTMVRQRKNIERFLVWPRNEIELHLALDSYSELFMSLVLLKEGKFIKAFIKLFEHMD